MAAIPWEMMEEILRRVGVKDLLRFRCVAKQWRDAIDEAGFIKRHAETNSDSSSSQSLLIEQCRWNRLDSDGAGSDFGMVCLRNDLYVSTCNGLVAFDRFGGDVIVLNPATRRSWTVRDPEVLAARMTRPRHPPVEYDIIGFGHDPSGGEYKLVRMTRHFPRELRGDMSRCEMSVYGLTKSRAWRNVGLEALGVAEIELECFVQGNAVVGGCIYWAIGYKVRRIVGLDLATEVFRHVPGPPVDTSPNLMSDQICRLKGRLCLAVFYCDGDQRFITCSPPSTTLVVWAQGVDSTAWSQLFSVSSSQTFPNLSHLVLLSFFNDDQLLMLVRCSRRVVAYSLRTRAFRDVLTLARCANCLDISTAHVVVPSLVAL